LLSFLGPQFGFWLSVVSLCRGLALGRFKTTSDSQVELHTHAQADHNFRLPAGQRNRSASAVALLLRPSRRMVRREPHTPRMCAGGEQAAPPPTDRARRQGARVSQADWSLEVGWPVYRSALRDIALDRRRPRRARRWGVNLRFLDLQAGKAPEPLAGAPRQCRRDHGASGQRLSSHRRGGLDGRVDLGDAPIEVGNGLALDGEVSFGVGSSIRERQIDGPPYDQGGAARQEAEHANRVQAHQHADHR